MNMLKVLKNELAANCGFVYAFTFTEQGVNKIKYGLTETATIEALKARHKSHENERNHTSEEEERITLTLSSVVITAAPSLHEDKILTFFNDDILGKKDPIKRRAYYSDSHKASEYRYLSEKAIAYQNYLRGLSCVATSFEDIPRIQNLPVPDFSTWSPEHFPYEDKDFLTGISNPIHPVEVKTEGDIYTDQGIVYLARRVMGDIDLDPASSKMANNGNTYYNQKGVQAKKIFTIHNNGLKKPWNGRVFLNPPFSSMELFMEKVVIEINSGRVTELFMIAPDYVITNGYCSRTGFLYRMYLCIPNGRVRFWGPQAKIKTKKDLSKSSAPGFGNVFFYYGPNGDKLKNELADCGVVYDPPTKIRQASMSINTYSILPEANLTEFLDD